MKYPRLCRGIFILSIHAGLRAFGRKIRKTFLPWMSRAKSPAKPHKRGFRLIFQAGGPAFLRSAALFPAYKCVEVCACQIDRLTKAQNGQISSPQNTWGYSCEVVAKSYPIRIVIQFSRCNEKTFHLFPLGSAELSGVFEKISLFCKRPLHSFGQRVLKCTPIFGLFPKKLFEKFIPSPIPTGKSQMHPLNGKIFPNEKPPHSFGQRVPKCTPILGLLQKTS